jgi:hypothetical protein
MGVSTRCQIEKKEENGERTQTRRHPMDFLDWKCSKTNIYEIIAFGKCRSPRWIIWRLQRWERFPLHLPPYPNRKARTFWCIPPRIISMAKFTVLPHDKTSKSLS